jgi:hypothetical protein
MQVINLAKSAYQVHGVDASAAIGQSEHRQD